MRSDTVSQEASLNGAFDTPEQESPEGSVSTVQTPGLLPSAASLTLNRTSLKHTVFVSSAIHADANRLRDDFLASPVGRASGLIKDSEPSSVLELVARFLRQVQLHFLHPSHDQETTRESRDTILTYFETTLVKADDIDVLVASLPYDPSINQLQRFSIIEAHYGAQFTLENH